MTKDRPRSTIEVRVIDTYRDGGDPSQDSIAIDEMYFRSEPLNAPARVERFHSLPQFCSVHPGYRP